MEQHEFRSLTMDDLDDAIKIYAEAFVDDPLFQYFLPNENSRLKTLYSFFRAVMKYSIQFGEIYGIGEPLGGLALWETPLVKKKIKLRGFVQCRFERVIFSPFFWTFLRAARVGLKAKKLHKKYAQGDHFYLNILAVHPDFQGNGLATKLVKPMIKKARDHGMDVYLETSNKENVPMYEHLGFEAVEQVNFGDNQLSIWSLLIKNEKNE